MLYQHYSSNMDVKKYTCKNTIGGYNKIKRIFFNKLRGVSKMTRKIISLLLIFILSTTTCFATSIDENSHYKIDSLQELKSELYNLDVFNLSNYEKKELINKTDPSVIYEFLDEKFKILNQEVESIEGEGKNIIDLGDNCKAIIYTVDECDDINIISSLKDIGNNTKGNTPGATTLWKKYGNRKFTSKFEVRSGIVDVDLILINHYKLSSKGVTLRYGESEVIKHPGDIDFGSVIAGSVNNVKSTAHNKGEKIHISCTFSFSFAPLYDITLLSKKFKMHNYVKFSDIDKKEKEVKVVQSWRGEW